MAATVRWPIKYFFLSKLSNIPEKSRQGKKQIGKQLQSVLLYKQTQ